MRGGELITTLEGTWPRHGDDLPLGNGLQLGNLAGAVEQADQSRGAVADTC